MVKKLLRFGVAGLLATPAHFLTLIFLVEIVRLSPVWGTIAGSVAGAFVNYMLNRRYTFASMRPHRETGPRFVAVALSTGVLNAVLVFVGTDVLRLHYLLVQCVATLVVFLANFLLNSAWTFRDENAT
jgi:putative flippase GtrA